MEGIYYFLQFGAILKTINEFYVPRCHTLTWNLRNSDFANFFFFWGWDKIKNIVCTSKKFFKLIHETYLKIRINVFRNNVFWLRLVLAIHDVHLKLSIVLFEQKAKLDGFVYARLQVFQKVTEIIKGNLDVIEFLKYMMDAFIVIVLCNRALTVLAYLGDIVWVNIS